MTAKSYKVILAGIALFSVYMGTSLISQADAQTSSTSCQITTSSCPFNSQYSGTFLDYYNNSNSNQAECMSRAFDFFSSCQLPSIGHVTSSFISGGKVVQ